MDPNAPEILGRETAAALGLPVTVPSTALFTDHYELTMLQAALRSGAAARRSVFEVFTRRLPEGRRYGVVAGTGRVLDAVENFRFDDAVLEFLSRTKVVDSDTLSWLAEFRFCGDIYGYPEGEVYFPGSPIIRVEGTFGEAVLLETVILSILNYDSAIAAAASRMAVAAAGLLAPAAGAVLQEGIDLLAIGLALRAVLPGRTHTITLSAADVALGQDLRVQHAASLAVVEEIRAVADRLTTQDADVTAARRLLDRLRTELLVHERADEEQLVPMVARALGPGATYALTRTHAEIEHQVARLARLLDDVPDDQAQREDLVELRRLLYGLYGVLRLHNAQEDETAFSLLPPAPAGTPAGVRG